MKITKIEKQKNNTNRYSIYVNEEFAIGVDESVLIDLRLHKGQKVDQSFLNLIFKKEIASKIYLKAINYLSYGMKTRQEIVEYLEKYCRENWSKKELELYDFDSWIDQAVNKLTEEGYINDTIYAQSYLRTHWQLNSKGPIRIERELKAKGVSLSDIDSAMEEYTESNQLEEASKLGQKYADKLTKKAPFKLIKQKTRQYLVRRGFSNSIISQVLEELSIDQDDEEVSYLLDKEAQKQYRRLKRRYTGFDLEQRLQQTLYRKGFSFDDINEWVWNNLKEGDKT